MPANPAGAKTPGKKCKAAKKAEELALKQEEERLATLFEEERLQREQIERDEELQRLAEEIGRRLLLSHPGFCSFDA
jgi:hypothetical protein